MSPTGVPSSEGVPSECVLVVTQCPDAATAMALARALVEARLAAAVNVGSPVSSIFRWRGELREAEEHPLVIKTHRSRFRAVERLIAERHPYEVPALVCLPATVSAAYGAWVTESVAAGG